MYFNPDISTSAYILFGISLLALVFVFVFYLPQVRSPRRRKEECRAMADDGSAGFPDVSVIVYAHDNSDNLEHALTNLLKQDYPGGYEVIVVNEGSSDTTLSVVSMLKNTYPNLNLTYTPDGARSLSRKKLAITIGVKAARNPVVVITDDATVVRSTRWLRKMMRHFADPATEVVLGLSMPSPKKDTAWGRRRRAFDFTASAVTWLSAAIAGHPYRGASGNIAFRRDKFFDNKGFSSSLNLRSGDDDIFINEITDGSNTVVELSPEATTRWNIYNYRASITRHRLSHEFTGRYVPHGRRVLMATGEVMFSASVITALAGAIACGAANIFGWAVAAVLALTGITAVAATWRKTLTALGSRRMFFTLPWLAATRPARNLALKVRCLLFPGKNYTWN